MKCGLTVDAQIRQHAVRMQFMKGQWLSYVLHHNENRKEGSAISSSRMNPTEKHRVFLTAGLFNMGWLYVES